MSMLNRRSFVQSSLAAGTLASAGVWSATAAKTRAQTPGANDVIRVAVAGLNGRGSSHVGEYLNQYGKGVEIAYLVDPDEKTYGKHLEKIKAATGKTPKTVKDIREALADPDLDCVSIATPNHWHSLMTVWACQAKKHVYVEKPMSHNVFEGRVAVDAARKYGVIVQHGTQSRSSGSWDKVAAAVKSGQLGKLHVARALCYKSRKSIGQKTPGEPPANLNYDLWLGPAQQTPYHGNLVHYNWHWFWEFGNGDIGNQGVHQMDVARWCIPNATMPTKVVSLGGRFGYEDQGQTPNTQISVLDFGETQLLFEVRGLPTPDYKGQKVGNVLHLEAGTIVGSTFYPKGSDKAAPLPSVETSRGPGGGNFGNFLAAVRSGKRQDLNADVLEGHYSSSLCHLANISYRLGKPAPFNPRTKAFGDDSAVYETLGRMEEHLKDQGLKLTEMQYTLGRPLTFDPAKERFVGDADADALLTREYRAPYTVPTTLG